MRGNSLEQGPSHSDNDDSSISVQSTNHVDSTLHPLQISVVEEDGERVTLKPQSRNTINCSTLLVVASIFVMISGPLASFASKWAFNQEGYTVAPSEIDEFMEPERYDDVAVQILFKHTSTLLLSLLAYALDTKLLHKKGKSMVFMDVEQLEGHRAMHQNDQKKAYILASIPALLDFSFSMFQASANRLIRSSTVQMISNLNVVEVALFSMCVLHKALTTGHVVAIFVVCVGVVLAGLDSLLFPDVNAPEDSNTPLALSFVCISATSRAMATVIEQRLMQGRPFPMYKFYAFEQGFVVIYIIIYLSIRALFDNGAFVDSFWQMVNTPLIFLAMFLHGLTAASLNAFGLLVGRLSNPIFRILVVQTRTITTWFLELCFGWTHFEWVALTGQLILAGGIVMYTGVLYPRNSRLLKRPLTAGGRLQPTPDGILTPKQSDLVQIHTQRRNTIKETKKCTRQERRSARANKDSGQYIAT